MDYCDAITTSGAVEAFDIMVSNQFQLYIQDDSGIIQIPEDVQEKLVQVMMQLVSKNPGKPFTITIGYNGPDYYDKAISSSAPEIIRRITPQIEFFAEEILKQQLSKQDKGYLACGRSDLMSATGQSCVNMFLYRYLKPKLTNSLNGYHSA